MPLFQTRSSLNARDLGSQPYVTAGKTTPLYICALCLNMRQFSDRKSRIYTKESTCLNVEPKLLANFSQKVVCDLDFLNRCRCLATTDRATVLYLGGPTEQCDASSKREPLTALHSAISGRGQRRTEDSHAHAEGYSISPITTKLQTGKIDLGLADSWCSS